MSKYRTFTPEFKSQVVLQVLTGTKSVAEVCREHKLKDSVFYRWKDEFLQNAAKVFRQDDRQRQTQARITDLEQLVGRLTLQLEVAKKASVLLKARSPTNET
jgi:transposase-like protein